MICKYNDRYKTMCIYIYNLKHNYICISLLYIYIHDYIYKKIWNNVFTSVQKLDSHLKKTELGGLGEDAAPPPKKK